MKKLNNKGVNMSNKMVMSLCESTVRALLDCDVKDRDAVLPDIIGTPSNF